MYDVYIHMLCILKNLCRNEQNVILKLTFLILYFAKQKVDYFFSYEGRNIKKRRNRRWKGFFFFSISKKIQINHKMLFVHLYLIFARFYVWSENLYKLVNFYGIWYSDRASFLKQIILDSNFILLINEKIFIILYLVLIIKENSKIFHHYQLKYKKRIRSVSQSSFHFYTNWRCLVVFQFDKINFFDSIIFEII